MATNRATLITDLGAEMGDVVTGTATGGSTTTVVQSASAAGTSPLSAGDDPQRFRGHFLYIASHAASAAPAFQERRISAYTIASQTLTVADAFSAAVAATDTYELHGLMSRTDKATALNRAIQNRLWYRTMVPLSLIGNSTFDADTTGWTGSSATLTQETTNVLRGVGALKLVTSAANGYAGSGNVDVQKNESYRVEVLVKPAAAGSVVKIVVYDVTNSAVIALGGKPSWDSNDGLDWVRLYATLTTPSTCRQIEVRLQDETNLKTSYWDDVILTHVQRRTLPLPSWCDDESKLEWVYRRTNDDPFKWEFVPVQNGTPTFDLTAVGGPMVTVSGDGIGRPLYVAGFRTYSSLNTDAATTLAPAEWAKAATAVEILTTLWSQRRGTDRTALEKDLAFWRRRLAACIKKYAPRREYSPLVLRRRAG